MENDKALKRHISEAELEDPKRRKMNDQRPNTAGTEAGLLERISRFLLMDLNEDCRRLVLIAAVLAEKPISPHEDICQKARPGLELGPPLPAITRVNRQLGDEATKMYYMHNVFHFWAEDVTIWDFRSAAQPYKRTTFFRAWLEAHHNELRLIRHYKVETSLRLHAKHHHRLEPRRQSKGGHRGEQARSRRSI